MRRLAAAVGRPVTFALSQNNADPEAVATLLDLAGDAIAADGVPPSARRCTAAPCRSSSGSRPSTRCTFMPAWGAAGLGAAAVGGAGRPHHRPTRDLKAGSSSRTPGACATTRSSRGFMSPERSYVLGDPPELRAGPERDSVAGIAARPGLDEWQAFCRPAAPGRRPGAPQRAGPQLQPRHPRRDLGRCSCHPATVFGLGDGGAHAGQTCDASTTTFMLTLLGQRPRRRPAVHRGRRAARSRRPRPTSTASATGAGWSPASKGDVNVIDHPSLRLHRPELRGRPARRRPPPRCSGPTATSATINAGQVTFEDGDETGARPGQLLRGPMTASPTETAAAFWQPSTSGTGSASGRSSGPSRSTTTCPPGRRRPASARPASRPGCGSGSRASVGYEHHPGVVAEGPDGVVVTEHTEVWTWETGETVALPFVLGAAGRRRRHRPLEGLLGPPDADERGAPAWHQRLDTADLSWVVDVTGRA